MYEGDYEEILLGKEVERDDFEKELVMARYFAISLSGKDIKEDDLEKDILWSVCLNIIKVLFEFCISEQEFDNYNLSTINYHLTTP